MRWRKIDKKELEEEFNGWEEWFAWHPVTVEDIHGKKWTVWWDNVRRKAFYVHSYAPGDGPHHYFRYQFDDAFNVSLGDKVP